MRFKEYINELSMKAKTTFIQGDNDAYRFSLKIQIPTEDGTEDFDFAADNFDGEWEVNFWDANDEQDIIPKGKGVALKLFAALPYAFEKFIKARKPKVLMFYASGASRIRLYDRLFNKIKGYKKSKNKNEEGAMAYILEK